MGIDPKYTDEQHAELLRLVFYVGLSVKQAVRTLAAGSNGLEGFVMPENTARKFVERHRNTARDSKASDRDNQAAQLLDDLYTVVATQVTQLLARSENGEKIPAREIQTTIANVRSFQTGQGVKAPKDRESDSVTSLVTRLQEQAQAA